MIPPAEWGQIEFRPSFRRPSLALWTSPAAVTQAEAELDGRDMAEAVAQAVLEFHGIASRIGNTTPLLCEAMSGADYLTQIFHRRFCELRRMHDPRRRIPAAAQWLNAVQTCGYPTRSGGHCRRQVRGYRHCPTHKRIDAELSDEMLMAENARLLAKGA